MANKYTATSFVTDTHAQCTGCKEIKPHSEFHTSKQLKHRKGCTYFCKVCACKKSQQHHATKVKGNTEALLKKKNSYLKSKYGITLQQYQDKLINQQVCAICGIPLSLNDPNVHLDHCHTTNKLRDFLCGNCNRGIGSFHDDLNKLKKAIMYLEKHLGSSDTQQEGRCL